MLEAKTLICIKLCLLLHIQEHQNTHSFMKFKSFAGIIPILLFIASLTSCAPKEIYESAWRPTPIKADGIAAEWEIPLRYYDNETRLNYAIANDKENLYICIRVTDELNQMKIIRAGLQLWMDTTGKKQQQVGVLFPVPNKELMPVNSRGKHGANPSGAEQTVKSDRGSLHKKLRIGATDMQLWGFKSPIGGITPISNTFGIKAALNWDSSGVMIYELVVPFKTFYHNISSKNDSSKLIGFTAIINGLTAPKRDNSDAGNEGMGGRSMRMGGGGMGGMGGGMPGGGGRGGMRGGGDGESNSGLYESNKFWIRFHLSSK